MSHRGPVGEDEIEVKGSGKSAGGPVGFRIHRRWTEKTYRRTITTQFVPIAYQYRPANQFLG